ncbi:hypothetical protein V1525DRAFT_354133 [Lipomyces kononenkoae]|uniref:Uncharacterized protein n=1 Tax=Lipomyces kononenkoae TaxID=34357 RepID=A0ACC3T9X5_LIPKO
MVDHSFQLQWRRLSTSDFTFASDSKNAPNQYNTVPRTGVIPLGPTTDYNHSTKMYSTVSNYYSSAASNESASATVSTDATPNFTSTLVDALIEDEIAPSQSQAELRQDPPCGRAWSPGLEPLVDERMGSSRPWSGFVANPEPAQLSSPSWIGPRVKLGPNSRSSSTTSTASVSTTASSSSTSSEQVNSAGYYNNYYHNSYYDGFDPDTKLAPPFQTMPEKNYTTSMTTAADVPTGFGLDFDVDLNLTISSASVPFTDNSSSDSSSVSPVSAISTIPALSTLTAPLAVPTSPTSSGPAATLTTTAPTAMLITPAQPQVQPRTSRRQGHNRNYRCRHCAQVFPDAASLKQHIALLPDATVSQRPYKCPEPSCDWHVIGFHRNNDCSRHYRQVHGVREFVCRWQGSRECRTHRFVTAWLRNRHERTVHAGEMESLGLDPDSGKDRSGARKRRKLQDP